MIKSTNLKQYQRIVKLLIESRENQGLTVRDLGDRLKIDNSSVSKVENLRRTLGLGEFIQYCDALGENPADIMELAAKK